MTLGQCCRERQRAVNDTGTVLRLWLCVRGAKHCAVAAPSRRLFLQREFACGALTIDGRVAHAMAHMGHALGYGAGASSCMIIAEAYRNMRASVLSCMITV